MNSCVDIFRAAPLLFSRCLLRLNRLMPLLARPHNGCDDRASPAKPLTCLGEMQLHRFALFAYVQQNLYR